MPDSKVNKAVVCPMCGEMSKAEIYTSVNVTVNRDFRSKWLDVLAHVHSRRRRLDMVYHGFAQAGTSIW